MNADGPLPTCLYFAKEFPKLDMPEGLIQQFSKPPCSPRDCVFALTRQTLSADLKTKIVLRQFGGNPDCSSCGCVASLGLTAIAAHRLAGIIPVGAIFKASVSWKDWAGKGQADFAAVDEEPNGTFSNYQELEVHPVAIALYPDLRGTSQGECPCSGDPCKKPRRLPFLTRGEQFERMSSLCAFPHPFAREAKKCPLLHIRLEAEPRRTRPLITIQDAIGPE